MKLQKQKYGSYRLDNRSEAEFAQHIKESHAIERNIIERYAKYLKSVTGNTVEIRDNGVDNSGEYLADKDVNTDADFLLDGVPYEVKYANKFLHKFRFKEPQLKSYLKQNATVVFVNGWETGSPKFVVWTPEDLQKIQTKYPLISFVGWGGKKAHELNSDDFNWLPLKERYEERKIKVVKREQREETI